MRSGAETGGLKLHVGRSWSASGKLFCCFPAISCPLLSSIIPVCPFTSLKESPPPVWAALKLLTSVPYAYSPSSFSVPPSVFLHSHLLPREYQRHSFILEYEGLIRVRIFFLSSSPYPNSTPLSSVFKEASPPSV